MSWLNKILREREELESPKMFWYWSALAALSAVVKDQVWLDRQIYKLYPNIYVMLHAESGLKKGPPVNMAKRFVTKVNSTRIISGRSSIQGILKELGTVQTKPGGQIIDSSTAFICSSELSSSIVEDKVATDILTDIYDRQYNEGAWKSLLKMEQFELKDPTVTMLTATNEAHSDDFFGKKDVQGGYFARTFIIYETKRNRINSLVHPLINPPNDEAAIEYLKDLSKLKGQFKLLSECEAGNIFEQWYNDFMHAIDEHEIKDETGTLNRFGDSVLKVAMLLSLAEEPNLIISETAMNEAISHCEKLIGGIRKATMGKKGKSTSADVKAMIIHELLKRDNHMISRAQLLKKFWMHFSASELDNDIAQSLEQAGVIKIEVQGNQVIYRMPENQVKEFENYFRGKNK